MSLVHLALAFVLAAPGGDLGDHRAADDGAARDASSAPPTSTLDDDVLDRIDEIVPPGDERQPGRRGVAAAPWLSDDSKRRR